MITAILVDDDSNLREGMKALLSRYAPEIKILGEAENVSDAVSVIDGLNPQVVFLDIQLADGTGFYILEILNEKNVKIASIVVFMTAHEQYAMKAFRYSALDVLLKPVDPEELHKVIEKIKNTIKKDDTFSHIDLLLESIRKK